MNSNQETDGQTVTALTVDPVITWLEQIRDFIGTTPRAQDMAQRAIDRLRPPAVDVAALIRQLRTEMGTWRHNGGALVSDKPTTGPVGTSAEDVGYYGGFLISESITRRNAIAMSFLPQLLEVAMESRLGRGVLTELARQLTEIPEGFSRVRDRLDGTIRLSRLAEEFNSLDDPELYAVSRVLRAAARGVAVGNLVAALKDAADDLASRVGGDDARQSA